MIAQESLYRETSDNRKIILTSSNKVVNEVVEGFINEAEEKFGQKEFERIKNYYNGILEQRNKDLNSDPVQFLITTNDEIESLVMQIDNEENLEKTTALQLELSNILINKQNELGVHLSKQKVMTNSMAKNFINNYNLASQEKDINKQFNMLSALEVQYGDLEPQVFAQLMHAGLPQGAKFLSSGFATKEDAMKILSLDQPEKIEALKAFLNDSNDTDVSFKKMRAEIRDNGDFKDIENIIRANIPFDTGESSVEMENIVDFLALYGANEFYAGDAKTFSEAAKSAALMFTKNFETEDTYYFPITYKDSLTGLSVAKGKKDKIIDMASTIKDFYLPDFKAVAFNSKKDGVEAAKLTETMEFQMKENGEWRNTADGTGIVYGIVMTGNTFGTIVNEAGEELYIPFDYNENTVPGTDVVVDIEIGSKIQKSRGYYNLGKNTNEEEVILGRRTNEIPADSFNNTKSISDVASALSSKAEASEIDNSWRQNETIKKIIKEDPIIEKIIMAESSGNAATPDSPVGARGLMQIMKNTAEKDTGFGVNYNLSYEELSDPEKNVTYGAAYYKGLKKYFGNERDALIAYNWGAGNTKKWLKKGGNIKELPKETRNYIKKILN